MKRFFSRLLPPCCVWCWREWAYCCHRCNSQLVAHPDICPLSLWSSYLWRVLPWFRSQSALEGVMICFSYETIIERMIKQLKYQQRRKFAHFLGQKLANRLLAQHILFNSKQRIIITTIPLHRYKHHWVRGYNQAAVLADTVSRTTGFPYIPLLSKNRTKQSLTRSSKRQRKQHISWSFFIRSWLRELLQWDEIIIIVDDVTTTGSTLQEAARTIHSTFPSVTIRWLVVARNMGNKKSTKKSRR